MADGSKGSACCVLCLLHIIHFLMTSSRSLRIPSHQTDCLALDNIWLYLGVQSVISLEFPSEVMVGLLFYPLLEDLCRQGVPLLLVHMVLMVL